jgi:hypothetical protein
VVDNDTGEGKPDSVRTSSGAFFGVGEDPVRTHPVSSSTTPRPLGPMLWQILRAIRPVIMPHAFL